MGRFLQPDFRFPRFATTFYRRSLDPGPPDKIGDARPYSVFLKANLHGFDYQGVLGRVFLGL